jgi:hypothetical protein
VNYELVGRKYLEKSLKRWTEATLKGDLCIRWRRFGSVTEVYADK